MCLTEIERRQALRSHPEQLQHVPQIDTWLHTKHMTILQALSMMHEVLRSA